MTLVVLSLLASAILATIAFLVAGRSATIALELDNTLAQDIEYKELFRNNPDYFNNTDFRFFFSIPVMLRGTTIILSMKKVR